MYPHVAAINEQHSLYMAFYKPSQTRHVFRGNQIHYLSMLKGHNYYQCSISSIHCVVLVSVLIKNRNMVVLHPEGGGALGDILFIYAQICCSNP